MSTLLTRDDLYDFCWTELGCKNPVLIHRLLRLMDQYCRQNLMIMPAEDGSFPVPFAHLGPGEADRATGMQRCAGRCGQVKKAGMFLADPGRPSGRKPVCRPCSAGLPCPLCGTAHKEPGLCPDCAVKPYRCRGCGVKPLRDFPDSKHQLPMLSVLCLQCAQGKTPAVPEVKRYLCRDCRARKLLVEFPVEKQKKPWLSLRCKTCQEKDRETSGPDQL